MGFISLKIALSNQPPFFKTNLQNILVVLPKGSLHTWFTSEEHLKQTQL